MNAHPSTIWKLAAGLFGLAVAGCSVIPQPQPDLTRYYVLASSGLNEGAVQVRADALRLGLKEVKIAPYLSKGTVTVRNGENEIVYNDYARWAEPLNYAMARVIGERLLSSPAVGRVFAYPYPFDQSRDYDVAVHVLRCEGVRDAGRASVRFSVMIEITKAGDVPELVTRRVFTARDRDWDGRDYGALVQAISADVDDLSAEIVTLLP